MSCNDPSFFDIHVIYCSNFPRFVYSFLPCVQHFDAMLRVRTAFVILSSVGLSAAVPVLDLPRGANLDANRPPFPVVNVIADQPAVASAQAHQLRGARSAQRSLLEIVDTAQKEFETSAGAALAAQTQQLDNLRQMTARVSGSA